MAEATKAFYNNAVLPLCDMVNSKLSKKLKEDIEVDYDDIDALKKDMVSDATAKSSKVSARKTFLETIKMELELGVLTQEEAKDKITLYDINYF
jgi:hypothetical protein